MIFNRHVAQCLGVSRGSAFKLPQMNPFLLQETKNTPKINGNPQLYSGYIPSPTEHIRLDLQLLLLSNTSMLGSRTYCPILCLQNVFSGFYYCELVTSQ